MMPSRKPASRMTTTSRKVKKLCSPPVKLSVAATTQKSTSICVQVMMAEAYSRRRSSNRYHALLAKAAV